MKEIVEKYREQQNEQKKRVPHSICHNEHVGKSANGRWADVERNEFELHSINQKHINRETPFPR